MQAYVWKIKGDKWPLIYVHRRRGSKALVSIIGAVYPKQRWAVLMPKPDKPTWGPAPQGMEPFNMGEWSIKTVDEVQGMAKKKAIKFDPQKKGWETKPEGTPSAQCEVCGFWHHSRANTCPQCEAPTKGAQRAREQAQQKAETLKSNVLATLDSKAQNEALDALKRKRALLDVAIALGGPEKARELLGALMDGYGVGGDFAEDLKALG